MSPFGLKELTGRVSGLYSDDQKRYLKSLGKCPLCEARGTADLIDTKGTVLGKLELRKAVKPTGEPLFARCKHCEGTWAIFAEKTPALPASEPTVEIVETEQTAERFRVDTMCLDNRGGTSPLRRSVTKSQEWSRSYEISTEDSSSSGKNLSVPLSGGTLGAKAEHALKNGYQLSEDKKAVVTDTFDFEVRRTRCARSRSSTSRSGRTASCGSTRTARPARRRSEWLSGSRSTSPRTTSRPSRSR